MNGQLILSTWVEPGELPIMVTRAHHLTVDRHSHDFYELVFVREGFCLHDVDDKATLLMEGDLFLIRPGKYHRYSGNRVVNIVNCLFAADQLCESLRPHPVFAVEGEVPRIHLELNERKSVMRLLTEMMAEVTERQPGWEVKLQGLLDVLLVDYGRMYSRRLGPDGQSQLYSGYAMRALAYIEKHYAQDISVREIAGVVGVSGDHLARQFKQMIGIAPLEYIRRYRLSRAMEMLGQHASVTVVARDVGFGSLAHFSREFKKELGLTPSQYRNQNQ